MSSLVEKEISLRDAKERSQKKTLRKTELSHCGSVEKQHTTMETGSL